MDTARITQFEELLARDPDDTVVRFGLGELYFQAKEFAHAAEHFAAIIQLDPQYSAAYRYLGQAYAALGQRVEAHETFARGIAIAEARGDLQTVKEMQVFLRRLHKRDASNTWAPRLWAVIIGTVYGLVDGAIVGLMFAWLYNTFADRFIQRTQVMHGRVRHCVQYPAPPTPLFSS